MQLIPKMLTISPSELSTFFTSGLLILTTTLAATSRVPKPVKVYLYTELAGTVVLETAAHLSIGFDTDTYRVLYCLAMIPIRLAAWNVAWKQSGKVALWAIPLGIALMFASTYGVHLDDNQWIIVVDGAVVTSAGLALAFTAAFSLLRRVYITLSLLWMILGIYDFGMVLEPPTYSRELESVVLPMIVIAAFGWVYLSVRPSFLRVADKSLASPRRVS